MQRPILLILCLIAFPFAGSLSHASISLSANERWVRNTDAELREIEVQLSRAIANNNEAALLPWLPTRLVDIERETEDCIGESTDRLSILEKAIEALGPADAVEEPSLSRRRLNLETDLRKSRASQAECRLMNLDARQLNERLNTFLKSRLTDRILARTPAIWTVLHQLAEKPAILADIISGYWRRDHDAEGHRQGLWLALVFVMATVLGVLLGIAMRRAIADQLKHLREGRFPRRFLHLLSRRTSVILGSGSLGVAAYLADSPIVLLFAFPMAMHWLLSPLIRAWLCGDGEVRDDEPAPSYTESCRVANALRPALAMALIWIAGVSLGGDLQAPDSSVQLLRHVYAVVFAVLLVRIVLLTFELPAMGNWRFWRLPMIVAVLAAPCAEFIGYGRLAEFLFNGINGSLIALAITVMLGNMWFVRLDSLSEGKRSFDRRLRRMIGFRDDEPMRVSVWLKLLGVILLSFAFLAAVLEAWAVPDAAATQFFEFFTHGFEVGSVTIVPVRLLLAILGFVLFMVLSRWLRVQLSERWLTGKHVDRGAREAITNLSVYSLIAIAVLVALNIAGVDLGNVAIIAGALSVGIGFGLQNIVNNFVSGLILLFERPIRPGDWIVVGETEGYVKKINIRYTQVQTFDRSDVIVPNSELLSTQVTNWMLRDNFGRVIAPVGVAYGTDVDEVRDMLLKIAKDHPLVLANDARVPTPKVYFMGFGESSLDFELRAFIRDVDYRLSVRSDLLFQINRAFNEAGIEIPFPQQDVHIKTPLPATESKQDSGVEMPQKDAGD